MHKSAASFCRIAQDQNGQSVFVDKAVQVDPLELQGMPPFPQLIAAAGGSGNYFVDSSSPTSPLERLPTDEPSDVSFWSDVFYEGSSAWTDMDKIQKF